MLDHQCKERNMVPKAEDNTMNKTQRGLRALLCLRTKAFSLEKAFSVQLVT